MGSDRAYRSAGGRPGAGPVLPSEREPVLDVLRGFAVLGILLVNIDYMRGADFLRLMAGEVLPTAAAPDRIAGFAVGWLAVGKFVSSFAIMFGLGAAVMAERARRSGRSPRGLLARRYLLLLPLGLAHMLLLFPGDILFVYGVTGLVLLAFVGVRARTALRWSVGLLVVIAIGTILSTSLALAPGSEADGEAPAAMTAFLEERRDEAVRAFTDGGYGDVVAAHAWESLLIQSGQLLTVPWILALFLLGYAVGRAGVLADLRGHRRLLRRAAAIGLGVGLPLNLAVGALGPLAMGAAFTPDGSAPLLVVVRAVALTVGAPLLATGYLSALALLSLRWGSSPRLAATGRMALSAYLLQSALALIVFAGFGLYERLSAAGALLVVLGIWAVLLVACPLWLRWFRFGPAEWAWRAATYGRWPALRAAR